MSSARQTASPGPGRPSYAEHGTDIARFADGGSHVVSVEYDGGGPSTSGLGVNVMEVDDVEILAAH